MLLSELVSAYINARNIERPIGQELSPKTREHLNESAAAFSRHLIRSPVVADLTAENLNQFLTAQLASGLSAYSVRNRRTGLLLLWRFAYRIGIAERCEGVRCVHCPPVLIDGYSVEKMRLLLRAVDTLRTVLRRTGIPKRVWWDSFLRTDWSVGARIGDMLRIEIEQFDPDGWLWVRESKTGKFGWRRLNSTTVDSVLRCIDARPQRLYIWPGYTRRNVCRAFTELAKRAGVGGSSKYIRRGGSSECDRLFPGNGWRFLRHSSPVVWERHYRVDKIVEIDAPGPPEL